MARAQGKDREFGVNWGVATLEMYFSLATNFCFYFNSNTTRVLNGPESPYPVTCTEHGWARMFCLHYMIEVSCTMIPKMQNVVTSRKIFLKECGNPVYFSIQYPTIVCENQGLKIRNFCHCSRIFSSAATQLKIKEDRVTVTGEKGYSMVRATHGGFSVHFLFTKKMRPTNNESKDARSLKENCSL